MRMLIAMILCAASASAAPIEWKPFTLPAGTPPQLQAQRGTLTVPLRRDLPDAGPVELAFVRLSAGGKGAPIVYLAGGPGGSGIAAARNPYAVQSIAKLAETGDVILLDQRGIGASTPRPVCPATPSSDPQRYFDSAAEVLPRIVAAARACAEQWTAQGLDLSGFTVRESAADVEDLRKALGVPKLSLLGHSYGTYLGLAIIREYGRNIERAVLISTAGPNHMRKLPLVLDAQLVKLSMLAGTDMTASLRRVLAKLERDPIAVKVMDRARKEEIEVRIGPDALRRILVMDIGDGNDFPVFPALLATIEQGDPSILAQFVEKRYNQAAAGGVDLMVYGMRCSGGATALRDRQIALEAAQSIFGNAQNAAYPAVCSVLPPHDPGDAFRSAIVSEVPVLFLSGTLDSNTPPYQAEELRWTMPNATHIIVPNAGHEDLEPNPEVQAAIADYLAGKDVSVRRIALPKPVFRSVEEAKRERR